VLARFFPSLEPGSALWRRLSHRLVLFSSSFPSIPRHSPGGDRRGPHARTSVQAVLTRLGCRSCRSRHCTSVACCGTVCGRSAGFRARSRENPLSRANVRLFAFSSCMGITARSCSGFCVSMVAEAPPYPGRQSRRPISIRKGDAMTPRRPMRESAHVSTERALCTAHDDSCASRGLTTPRTGMGMHGTVSPLVRASPPSILAEWAYRVQGKPRREGICGEAFADVMVMAQRWLHVSWSLPSQASHKICVSIHSTQIPRAEGRRPRRWSR
jgi:hypothetical protein